MALDEPRLVARDEVQRLRPRLSKSVKFEALWVAGTLDALQHTTIAVVGSRAPSEAGRNLAFETARTLAHAGVCVVSGLALGIDGAAHAGALAGSGATIGVLGGGHRDFYPRRNRALAERMLAGHGAVISPFSPDHPSYPAQFLQRNGIVAALADAVVIVEAAARSGALNTASWASDLSLPVFAFPGDVDRPKVAGCLALLRDGATLVRGAEDILSDLGLHQPALELSPGSERTEAGAVTRSALQRTLLSALSDGELHLDGLLERVVAPPPCLLAALTALELEGVVERRPGQRYGMAMSGGKTTNRTPSGAGALPSVVHRSHP